MVVQSGEVIPSQLDLGYLAYFLGLRMNELVVEQLEKAGLREVRQSHGYVIQHLIGAQRSITELAERMGVTQQASSKMVAELVGLGVVKVTAGRDRRAKLIGLSADGERLVNLSRRARKQVHQRLVQRIGEGQYEVARGLMMKCLGTLGGLEAIRERRIRAPR